MASPSTGAMKSVLFKLNQLLGEEYVRAKLRRQVKFMVDELPSMLGVLEKLSDTEDLDPSVKRWASQVREMTYDLEDSIDPFMHSIAQGDPHRRSSFITKALLKQKQRLKLYKFYEEILEIRDRFLEAIERKSRYKLERIDDAATSSRWRAVATIHAPLPALLHGVSNNKDSLLVGIDGRGDKLIQLLLADDQQRLKVVAVVGMGGSGKTTLAINVYEMLQDKFGCWAFVSVSRNPDIMEILQQILRQVGAEQKSIIGTTIEQLVLALRNFLSCKRFLIVTDGIWSTTEWRMIKTALPENNLGSRILVTTRVHSVAHSCCYLDKGNIFQMELLTDTEAMKLLSVRLFGPNESCPPDLVEISNEIMRNCGGVPLAINSMAGVLAGTPLTKDSWEKIRDYAFLPLYRDAGTGIICTINLSYVCLPPHLKTCLLYLSMFPEDHVIDRKQLVRRWIAEGFITEDDGKSSTEVGENYFDELLNRNLVQLARVQYDNRVDACQVHDIIWDFIVSKSAEENFVITYGNNSRNITGLPYTIRRLSLGYRNQCDTFQRSEINTSHVRSLAVIGPYGKMPALENCCALRVLHLENFGKLESHFIIGLRRLYLLKYLRLQTTSVIELPEALGELQYLQTLDLSGAPVIKLPKSIVLLRQLMYLLVSNVKLPDGFGRMTSLQELSCIKIDTADALQELEKLSRLKVIGLQIDVGSLVSLSQQKLSAPNLRSLYVESADDCSLEFLMDFFSLPCYELKEFQMKSSYFLPTVPMWVSSLVNVTLLCINIQVVGEEELKILGELPALISLILTMQSEASGQGLIIPTTGFKRLKKFELTCWNSWIKLFFELGAMNNLEKLAVVFSAQEEDVADGFHVGLEHLASLKHLVAKINCRGATAKDVNAAEDVIKNLIRIHPNNKLRIELQRHNEHIIKAERDISIQDEEDNDQDEVSDNVERDVVVEGESLDPTETIEPKLHQLTA